jgi:class I fructose-bisphosphate aldolase
MRAGARGAVVGRNIWGEADMEHAARAYAGVIHDRLDADEAIARA